VIVDSPAAGSISHGLEEGCFLDLLSGGFGYESASPTLSGEFVDGGKECFGYGDVGADEG